MASDFLFDISDLDLDNIVVSPEEVGEINPQCGDMRQLDHVIFIDVEVGKIAGVKHVREDEFWVPLHIPGRPLMPGVLMIEASAQLCSVHYRFRSGRADRFIGFTRCDQVSFRGQVVPGDTLLLLSDVVNYSPRRVVSRTQGIVDGRLVYDGKITGMVM